MMLENAINQAIDNVLDHNMPATKPTRIMTRELILDALDGAGLKIVPVNAPAHLRQDQEPRHLVGNRHPIDPGDYPGQDVFADPFKDLSGE